MSSLGLPSTMVTTKYSSKVIFYILCKDAVPISNEEQLSSQNKVEQKNGFKVHMKNVHKIIGNLNILHAVNFLEKSERTNIVLTTKQTIQSKETSVNFICLFCSMFSQDVQFSLQNLSKFRNHIETNHVIFYAHDMILAIHFLEKKDQDMVENKVQFFHENSFNRKNIKNNQKKGKINFLTINEKKLNDSKESNLPFKTIENVELEKEVTKAFDNNLQLEANKTERYLEVITIPNNSLECELNAKSNDNRREVIGINKTLIGANLVKFYPTDGSSWICSFCDKAFRSKWNRNNHIRVKHHKTQNQK